MTESSIENLKKIFLENLLAGNRAACSDITRNYLAINPSIDDLYEELFKTALYKVGKLWETNQISVATEHLATAITEGILNELFETIISKKRYQKTVVLACVENELHQVGIKMVADIFEKNGWDSFFLGTGIPTKELLRFIRQAKPDLLAISLSVYFNLPNLLDMLKRIRAEFPELVILLGGQAIQHLKKQDLPENCSIFSDLYQLESYIETRNNLH
jgi:methanogenic corrinoid protein MtbC1